VFKDKKRCSDTMNNEFSQLLKPYEKVFSKPQRVHFESVITGLTACEIPSIARISEISDKSRSSLDRFFTESPWKIQRVKTIFQNQIQPFIALDSSLLLDDTISQRPYAVKVEKANYHYSHSDNKEVLGYNLVTAVISSDEEILPYNLISYYRKEDCTDRKFKTKNQIASEIITSTAANRNISLVIFDSWYSNKIVIGACKKAKKDYITQIKSNRNVTINGHENAVRAFVKDIDEKDWELTIHNQSTFRIFATSAFISGIGSIHLIYCQKYDDSEKKWGATHFLISNLLKVPSMAILHKYLCRVGIEGFHRDAKQNLGLEGYYLRKNRGIEKYLFLVMIAYAFLAMQKMKYHLNLSIGELCEEHKIVVYKQTLRKIEKNPEFEDALLLSLAKAKI